MPGFRSPLFVLGLSAVTAVTQAGFRTPIPPINMGASPSTVQAGFVTPIPFLNIGANPTLPPKEVKSVGGGSGRIVETIKNFDKELLDQIIKEDEELMSIITIFMEMNQ